MPIGRDKLVFIGLVALDEVVEHCMVAPYRPTFALRVVLAMLYSLGDGTREPFDAFWVGCQIPNCDRGAGSHIHDERVQAASGNFEWIIRVLGVDQSLYYRSDLHAARRKPIPSAKAYSAHQRRGQSPEDAARQRFAEALRVRSNAKGSASDAVI